MAVGFAALDKRIIRDTETLHDFLWHGEKKDETSMSAKLRKDGRDADAFLHLGGRLRKIADSLAQDLSSSGKGESLFELLEHSWGLAAATVLRSKGNYRGAATSPRCQTRRPPRIPSRDAGLAPARRLGNRVPT